MLNARITVLFAMPMIVAAQVAGGQVYLATDDAYVDEAQPGTSFGASSRLDVRSGDTSDRSSYVKFSLPSGAVSSAVLRLYNKDIVGDVSVSAVADSSWDENSLTWSTRPPAGLLLDTVSVTVPDTWYELDVTSGVIGGASNSFVLTTTSTTSSMNFRSKEGGQTPELVVTLVPPTPIAVPDLTDANVVVILADDLGWGDISLHSTGDPFTEIPTPNIDQLVNAGIKLDNFFVQPVCSPTRAELLTGRAAARAGVAPVTINERNGQHMSLSELTMAEAFGGSGYDSALIGKWHLGGDAEGPLSQGFGHFVGILRAAADYFTRKEEDGTLLWQRNGTYEDIPGYTTDLIAAEAVDYIETHTSDPFFLYVPFTAPHNPQQAKAEDIARVPAGFDPSRTTYAAMVISLDDAVGTILDALDSNGLTDNTIVLFASDNGGGQPGNNLPLHGGKGNVYDGGVRVVASIRIPQVPGGRVATGMMAAADVYPTLFSLVGLTPPAGPPLDGIDFSSAVVNASSVMRSEDAWLRPTTDGYRTADWKLVRRVDYDYEIYNVANDPNETNDLAGSEPSMVDTLVQALDAWNSDIPAYPSHVPPTGSVAVPSGDIIHVHAQIGPGATGAPLQIRLARAAEFQVHPGDRLEYDMFVQPNARADGIALDLNNLNQVEPWGDDGEDFRDQDGHNLGTGEAFTNAIGAWARRTIGLGGIGTSRKSAAKLMLLDLSEGEYDLFLDNIIVRRYDGSEVSFYLDGGLPDLDVDDDGVTGVTTTVTVALLCGNGIVDPGEVCDDGSSNGTGASCCGADCQHKPDGAASCDGNDCTRPDTCTSGVCTPGECAGGQSCTICGGTCNDGASCACVF